MPLKKVAKGDYHETIAPTANLTSVCALMQIAAQNNFLVHQMDVNNTCSNRGRHILRTTRGF